MRAKAAATANRNAGAGRGRASVGLDLDTLQANAQKASEFLKALSHEVRLLILCFLMDGEKSVSEIEHMLRLRQPAVSQQLARLRTDGLVETQARRQEHLLFAGADRGARSDRGPARRVLPPAPPALAEGHRGRRNA